MTETRGRVASIGSLVVFSICCILATEWWESFLMLIAFWAGGVYSWGLRAAHERTSDT